MGGECEAESIATVVERFSKECDTSEISRYFDDAVYNDEIPKITIQDYIARLKRYVQIETVSFHLCLYYMKKLVGRWNNMLNEYTAHRIVLGCLVIAAKYVDDEMMYVGKMKGFAWAGGVCSRELADIEKNILDRLDFDLFVESNEAKIIDKRSRNDEDS